MHNSLFEKLTVKDLNELNSFLENSAEIDESDPDVICLVALCYRYGKGIEKDEQMFNELIQKAAEAGSKYAKEIINKKMLKEEISDNKANEFSYNSDLSFDWSIYEIRDLSELKEMQKNGDSAASCQIAWIAYEKGWMHAIATMEAGI